MEENEPDEITELTYLNVNNPWRWKGNIENNLNLATDEKVLKMLVESGIAYLREFNIGDKDLLWYFEDDLTQEIISPGHINKKYGSNKATSLVESIINSRRKNHLQNLEDVKKIYSLVRSKAIERGIDVKKYPENLEELTE
jgi:hypothetical protein